jgi:hypothetical protein
LEGRIKRYRLGVKRGSRERELGKPGEFDMMVLLFHGSSADENDGRCFAGIMTARTISQL